jgi:protein-L-isoaspartate(D-aspartate) O-methyltransferase
MPDFSLQRKNMVESQIRPSDITDRRIIRAMVTILREAFVPAAATAIAYSEEEIVIAEPTANQPRRAMLVPRTLAALIQAMDIGDQARVLIIGAGTGYSAALLSTMASAVVALEQPVALADDARRRLSEAGIQGVRVETGPLEAGYPAAAPYDAILVEGAVDDVPPDLLDQLKDECRLVAVRLERGIGRATVWRRSGATFSARAFRDASALLLPGFERKRAFVF